MFLSTQLLFLEVKSQANGVSGSKGQIKRDPYSTEKPDPWKSWKPDSFAR